MAIGAAQADGLSVAFLNWSIGYQSPGVNALLEQRDIGVVKSSQAVILPKLASKWTVRRIIISKQVVQIVRPLLREVILEVEKLQVL